MEKPRFKKSEMHGGLPVKGYSGKCTEAPRRGAIQVPKNIGGDNKHEKDNTYVGIV